METLAIFRDDARKREVRAPLFSVTADETLELPPGGITFELPNDLGGGNKCQIFVILSLDLGTEPDVIVSIITDNTTSPAIRIFAECNGGVTFPVPDDCMSFDINNTTEATGTARIIVLHREAA